MKGADMDRTVRSKRSNAGIKAAGTAFLILLAALIFFSRTIYTYNLANVTAARPTYGTLSKSESAKSAAEYAEVVSSYNEIAGRVGSVYVAEGDRVSAGQPLYTMRYDADDTQKKLDEYAINKEKLALEIENINIKIERLEKNIAELAAEIYEAAEVSEDELAQIDDDIQKAEAELQKTLLLADVGAVAMQDVEKAINDIHALYAKYEKQEETIADAREKAAEDAAAKEKTRAKQLNDYAYDRLSYDQELKGKDLELKNIELQEASLIKTLASYAANETAYAPCDGIVVEIAAQAGQNLNAGQQSASFAINDAYKLEFDVPADNTFILTGDACKVSNSERTFDTEITKITPHERGKTVTVMLYNASVTAGETFDITVQKESPASYSLLPNGAVNRDGSGYFVFEIKRRDGILGKEFYATRRGIEIGDSDDEYTAVISRINIFEPVAVLSDKAFQAGDTINLTNESDFFE